MSSFFWSFDTAMSDLCKKQSFVGKDTGLPTRLSDKIYLTSHDASLEIYNQTIEKPSGQASYLCFYDVNSEQVSNPEIERIRADIKIQLAVVKRDRTSTPERERLKELHRELDNARLRVCQQRHKAGEIGLKAVVGAWLHESLLSQYDEDHVDECDEGF